MAITDLIAMKAMVRASEQLPFYKEATGNLQVTATLMSSWMMPPGAPATPPTVVCTRATAGALVRQSNSPDARVLRLVQAYLQSGQSSLAQSVCIICDRLAHSSGISAASAGTFTTNLPTAALGSRYPASGGVMAAIEVYSTLGATATTVTVSYTNQASAAAVSREVAIGGTGDQVVGRFFPIPLAQGDTSVRAVNDVTLVGGTTGGSFGITLYKPLYIIPAGVAGAISDDNPLLGLGAAYPEIATDACLFFITRGESNYISGPWAGSLLFALDQ